MAELIGTILLWTGFGVTALLIGAVGIAVHVLAWLPEPKDEER